MCTHTHLNNIWPTTHNKVVRQIHKLLFPLLNKIHIPNEYRHPPWKPPETQSLHGYICASTPQDHADAVPYSDLTPCHHQYLPEENHTLHHLKLEPIIHGIHTLPRPQSHPWHPTGKTIIPTFGGCTIEGQIVCITHYPHNMPMRRHIHKQHHQPIRTMLCTFNAHTCMH